MQVTNFCDHLYDESTDGYIQILKLNDDKNGDKTIKIYKYKSRRVKRYCRELHKKEDVFLAPNTMYLPKEE